MTGAALFFSVLRDAFLSHRIDNQALFVTYVSLCAILTTPFGERMQYGLKVPISPRQSFLLFFVGLVFFGLLILVSHFKLERLAFSLGFIVNVFCALSVASILGSIASSKGPSTIRMLGPIFPISNILLVLSGLNSYIYVVTISYLITLLAAVVWLLIYFDFNKILIHPKKVEIVEKNDLLSFFLHYLSFFVAYIIVMLNLKIDIMSGNLIKVRFPIYVYSIITFSLPYINKKILGYIVLSSNLFILLAIFLFLFEEKFISFCIIECYIILILSRIASKNSL
jgi:hypothetical protein